jgi:ABC-type uncharacterized transport system permease subunit
VGLLVAGPNRWKEVAASARKAGLIGSDLQLESYLSFVAEYTKGRGNLSLARMCEGRRLSAVCLSRRSQQTLYPSWASSFDTGAQ